MPAGDVWGNAWGDSWNSYWKQATTPPVVVTPTQHTGAFGPVKKTRRRKINRDEYGNDYLEPLVPEEAKAPTDRVMTSAELAEMRELLLAAEKAKLEAKRKEEETLILLLMAA